MIVFPRKKDESIVLGDDIIITVIEIGREVYKAIRRQEQERATVTPSTTPTEG